MAGAENEKSDVASILSIGLIDIEKQSVDDRARTRNQLREMLEASTRFRVAEVAGKVLSQQTDNGLALIFRSDLKAPLECAIEIGRESKRHPEVRFGVGIHAGPVIYRSDSDEEVQVSGEAVDIAQRIAELGDAGHILFSKRTAYEFATDARWNEYFYELGEVGTNPGKISVVNFYNDEVGNPELPSRLKHERAKAAREEKLQSLRRPLLAASIIVLLIGALFGGYLLVGQALKVPPLTAPPSNAASIVVLPFVDLSPLRDQEYLAEGISEELLDTLEQLKGIRVIGRASAAAFKNKNLNGREIAARLNVRAILQGTVRRVAKTIGISVQLINARDGSQIWARSFERDAPEIPTSEDEIVRAVATQLHLPSVFHSQARAWDDPLTNDLYLQGLFLSHKNDDENLRASLDFFRLALARNPKLTPAWTNSAKDLIQLGEHGGMRPLEAYLVAQEAAIKALAVDSNDAEAHVYYGDTKRVLAWDLNGNDAELKRALEIDSDCVAAHLHAALLQNWLGSPRNAIAHLETAERLDPYSPLVGHIKVMTDLAQDRLEPALAAVQQMMDTDPNYTYFEVDLALVYREQGKLQEALEIYSRLAVTRPQPGLAITYVRLNRRDDAEKILAELTRPGAEHVAADEIAAIYVALGDRDKAFHWLTRAIDQHSPSLYNIGSGRDFRSLRSDPRYPEFLRRIGLDPKRFPPR